ncbi:hypothetical protein EW146_g5786 [Bondarzewia mesenterica]|uniref:DUF202 domain-containing protein n=1 Tax=Bondarzewia mesenterica TaxID=1095465 RepID=A0A4V6S1E9_9AGAM|nr:hypothetical protein EW146_g5786 [Bondarzewia mesenterica]
MDSTRNEKDAGIELGLDHDNDVDVEIGANGGLGVPPAMSPAASIGTLGEGDAVYSHEDASGIACTPHPSVNGDVDSPTGSHTPPLSQARATKKRKRGKRSTTSTNNDELDPPTSLSPPSPSSGRSRIPPWLYRFSPVLVLENTGSVARDHLALERTFLAYVRTSLAFASAGVALVQLFTIASNTASAAAAARMTRFARPLGATVILIGMFVLVVGTTRYFRIQTLLTRGLFPAARLTVALQAFAVCALTIVVFGGILGVRK